MVLADEFDRLIGVLEAAELQYAVAGGLAVAIWGAPRATKDIDLVVQREDLDAIKAAIHPLGFTIEAGPQTFRDGMELRRISKVSANDLLTLDFLLVNAVTQDAWQSRERVETDRGPLWVVSRDALIAMKLLANRPQDVFDVERLRELDR